MTSRTSFLADIQQDTKLNTFFPFEYEYSEDSDNEAEADADKISGEAPNDSGAENVFISPPNSTGFFVRQHELFKRRLWPVALTFLSLLLYNVVGLVTVLSINSQEAIEEGLSAAERSARFGELLKNTLGYGNTSVLMIIVPVAAVLAIEGFSWMDSRREVDFYESQPLSRGKRFLDICVGSFLYFIFSYVITLEAGLLITGIFHALTRAVLSEILWNSLCVIALFLSVYSLGVLAAMLTGNVIVACLAFLVLILYEPIFRAVMAGYSSEYLTTYGGSSTGLLAIDLLNPVARYYNSAPFCLSMPLILLAVAALYFGLARLSYHIRKNEHAGTPVVFAPVRTIVRIAMAVIVGLAIGLFFSFVRNTFFIIVLWMLLFTVIAACIMQIIYDLDFRALFRRPLEILVSAVIVMLIFFAFLFDVAGYDRFVPDPEKVEDAVLYTTNTDNTYIAEDGTVDYDRVFPEEYMHLRNVEDVVALAEYCQAYTRSVNSKAGLIFPGGKSIAKSDGPAADGSGSSDSGQEAGNNTDIEVPADTAVPKGSFGEKISGWDFRVVYRMKNGKEITRTFLIPSTIDPAMMDAVIGTGEYREGTLSIYHDDYIREALKDSAKLQIDYTNGNDYLPGISLDQKMYEEFRAAYTKDLEQFSYSFARQNRPVGSVGISSAADNKQGNVPAISCPVYPSYSRTIDFLKKYGIWLEALDLSEIPVGDYDSLTAEQQELIDNLDTSVLSGPFNPYYY